jgi:hypothetical protein
MEICHPRDVDVIRLEGAFLHRSLLGRDASAHQVRPRFCVVSRRYQLRGQLGLAVDR